MVEDPFTARRGLSFAQAEGAAPLPRQLELREVSGELKARLWANIYTSMNDCVGRDTMGYGAPPWLNKPWSSIMAEWHVNHLNKFIDEFTTDARVNMTDVKLILTSNDYVHIFGFVQFLISHRLCPHGLRNQIEATLQECGAAYRIVDDLVVPIAFDEQADAIRAALVAARNAVAKGPQSHLRAAALELTARRWAGSVRESITAVEASAKFLEPDSGTLGPALSRLRQSIGLHPALSHAFGNLYGWTNQEGGVRHAMVFEDEAKITERDAIFMYGACASFVAYLLSVSQEVKSGKQ